MRKRNYVIYKRDRILEYLEHRSKLAYDLLSDKKYINQLLIVKKITHSDLVTAGKRLGNESLDRNLLYYMTTEQMQEIEKTQEKKFESAKQSNIFMPDEFYNFLHVPKLNRRIGKQSTQHNHVVINDYADIYLVNDSLEFFDIKYTEEIFKKLKKTSTWNFEDYKIFINNKNLTEIIISHAIHGIGTSKDIEFHKLRHSIFRGDTLNILLLENFNHRFEVYLILEKNPRFYTILGINNKNWEDYLKLNNKEDLYKLIKDQEINYSEAVKSRTQQNRWRLLLADEMMNYTTNDNEIFCPLTYISIDFSKIGTLFRASHIKEFKSCNIEEAYDVNNGILMVANADALFDKHLITIADDGKIIYSFLFKNEYKLIQELRLSDKVFEAILNDKRREYLYYHREQFKIKEEQRKTSNIDDLDIIEDAFMLYK